MNSCSLFRKLNLIIILCPHALNFGKDVDASRKILKESFTVVPDTRQRLLEDAISYSLRLLLTEGTSGFGMDLSLYIQGGSNMTGTDLYVNKPHCAAAVRP